MNFSVREIAIVTAYSALVLSSIEAVIVLVLIASASAMLFILVVFGFSTFRKIFAPDHGRRSLSFRLPLYLLVVAFLMPPSFAILTGFVSDLIYLQAAGIGMTIGVGAASVPLLFMLDSRYPTVTSQLLAVGYWSLLAGSVAGAVFAFSFSSPPNPFYSAPNPTSAPNPGDLGSSLAGYRFSAVGGLVASVITSWFLSPKTGADDVPQIE